MVSLSNHERSGSSFDRLRTSDWSLRSTPKCKLLYANLRPRVSLPFNVMLHVCPTDVVHAPAERVWQLIATPNELAEWSDTKVVAAPGRELRAGDRLVLGAGIGHLVKVTFDVTKCRTTASSRH